MITQERIKDLCEKQGTTVTALERELNISNGALKKDGPLKSDRLYTVAKELGVSMEYLVGATDNPTPITVEFEESNDEEMREAHLKRIMTYYVNLKGLLISDQQILALPIPEDEKDVLIAYRKADDVTKEMVKRLLRIL